MTTPYAAVATIMSWPVATVDHETSLQEAAEALAASHEDPRHVAVQTTGAVVEEIIPNTALVVSIADATYTNSPTVETTMSFDAAENTTPPVST